MKWSDTLAEELHKQRRIHFPRRRVIVGDIDDTWSADLVDMQAFADVNDGTKFILTVIDVFSKYAWAVPLKTKRGIDIQKAFVDIVKESRRKPKHLWVDKGTEFYNVTMKRWLKDADIKMYSTENEGKAVVVERFNRTLKSKMWKYFSANSTYKYTDILQKLIQQYNNTKHRSVKMTPVEASRKGNKEQVYSNLYHDLRREGQRNSKYQIGDRVRLIKQKRHFEKGYTPNWTEEVFLISEIMPTNPLTYAVEDLEGDRINGTFYEQELSPTSIEVFRIEKIIRKDKKKRRALVKWKGYSEKFNSWVSLDELVKL